MPRKLVSSATLAVFPLRVGQKPPFGMDKQSHGRLANPKQGSWQAIHRRFNWSCGIKFYIKGEETTCSFGKKYIYEMKSWVWNTMGDNDIHPYAASETTALGWRWLPKGQTCRCCYPNFFRYDFNVFNSAAIFVVFMFNQCTVCEPNRGTMSRLVDWGLPLMTPPPPPPHPMPHSSFGVHPSQRFWCGDGGRCDELWQWLAGCYNDERCLHLHWSNHKLARSLI